MTALLLSSFVTLFEVTQLFLSYKKGYLKETEGSLEEHPFPPPSSTSQEGERIEVGLEELKAKVAKVLLLRLRIPSKGGGEVIFPLRTAQLTSTNTRVVGGGRDGGNNLDRLSKCFYETEISEGGGGSGVFSLCGPHHPPGSVSGRFILGGEDLVIEPSIEDYYKDYEEDYDYPTNPNPTTTDGRLVHRIYPANLTTKTHGYSDAARVPPEELEKAIEEAEKDLVETEEESLESEEQILETLAANNKTPKVKKGTSNGNKVIELAVFTDVKLFEVWTKKYPKDTKNKLKAFILSMLNNMNLLYGQPSLGLSISFRLVYLEIMESLPKKLDVSGGVATPYLRSFCKYAGGKNSKGEEWDHALLLTGADLKEGTDTLITGMAWFNTMCMKYWSCSVSEGTSFGTSFVLTHELGHSLGMEHDGSGISRTCSADQHIMSPTTGAGKVTWSTCSKKNVLAFLKTGNSEGGRGTVPTCLTKVSSLSKGRALKGGNKLPGLIYGPDVQCRLDCGNNCSAYNENTPGVCSMLLCVKDKSLVYKSVRGSHPALEGTPCGIGMHCRFGKCVIK